MLLLLYKITAEISSETKKPAAESLKTDHKSGPKICCTYSSKALFTTIFK
jgi:hypothetical protein